MRPSGDARAVCLLNMVRSTVEAPALVCLLVLQDGAVLTDFRGEAPGCLPSPA